MRFFFLMLASCTVWANATTAAENSRIEVCPEITDDALINPGMGWVCFHYSNRLWAYGSKNETGEALQWFPGASTIYFRLPWSCLEPEEGKFRWDIVDSFAQPWIQAGKKIAFRVICCDNRYRYTTPEWVHRAGAKGIDYTFSTRDATPEGVLWEPDYKDPIFLAKLDHFLDAMGKRYNDNPNVAFVDIGTFGLWGEGHTFFTSKLTQEQADEVVRLHVDLHCKHFPDTLLCISDDVAGNARPGSHFPSTDYALSKGVTLRDDSILVGKAPKQWFHAELAGQFWPTLPVIVEHEHYGLSRDRGAWDKDLLARSVEEYHASYMSIHWWPKEFLDANRDAVDRINRRLGYRLELRKATYPKTVELNEPFEVESVWSNVGVAPCYGGGFVAYTLIDSNGKIAWVCVDESFDVKTLPVAAPEKSIEKRLVSHCNAGFVAPIPVINEGVVNNLKKNNEYPFGENISMLEPGKYSLHVSVGTRDGTPVIALPLNCPNNGRRYHLGEIIVTPSNTASSKSTAK